MELKIHETIQKSLDTLRNSKDDQEKAAAIVAALHVIEQLQTLENKDPKLFARIVKSLEGNVKERAKDIDDLQP